MFVVHCLDKSSSAHLRAEHRPTHLAYVKSTAPQLIAAGPLLSADGAAVGGLFILAADSHSAAVKWAENDPFHKLGVYEAISVHSWKSLLGTGIAPQT